ncbi:hypothetical protein A1359_12740 [Methylomonas lenta]|uniref:Uncharacterized protein n=1 Tax=Methylomonas lenta TaxID=980561 RepID=A0A177N5C6_9GAMM|nr:hypothetical protein [Methylomonas lenta]OAI13102.1 hypothetical protein A1359_12740 [Methylomonas lenta]
MKKIHLNLGILGGLLLMAAAVDAAEYPAADFQPKVIYIDESVVKTVASITPPPCVSQGVVTKQIEEVDPRYPASSFQPKVIFSEGN